MTSTHTRLLAATLALACQLNPAHAAKVHWADFGVNAAGAGAPEIIGAPDATIASPGDWHLAKFNTPGIYPTLAAKIGLSEAELVSYDVIAWEANGGSPAAGGGWESARWTFSDFSTSVSSTFNELTGGSSDPTVQFKTGSVAGAVYNILFGTGVPEKTVWSWPLVRLPDGLDAHSASFHLHSVAVGGAVGLGDGTPDPDAFGVLSAVPEPGSWALLPAGLLALGWSLRRRDRIGCRVNGAIRQKIAAAALVALTGMPAAASVLIDDFTTGGFYAVQGPLGFGNPADYATHGSMVGGERLVAFETSDAGSGSGAASQVGAGADAGGYFIDATGPGIAQRTSILYGYDRVGGVSPLALDLSGQDRIRVNFLFNSAQLNFNILLYNGITPYTQIGINILRDDHPFSVDFNFADGIYPSGPIDFSHIDLIYLQTQSTEFGQSFAIQSIMATVPEPDSAALLLCGGLALALRRKFSAAAYFALQSPPLDGSQAISVQPGLSAAGWCR